MCRKGSGGEQRRRVLIPKDIHDVGDIYIIPFPKAEWSSELSYSYAYPHPHPNAHKPHQDKNTLFIFPGISFSLPLESKHKQYGPTKKAVR
jgi:hypothetical protein